MSEAPQSKHPTEAIPDEAHLFRRVPENRAFPDGRPKPGAFSNKDKGMSVSWDKYAQASQCRGNPATCGVARLAVAAVRKLQQEVAHTPRDTDQAHSDVIGEKDEEVRLELSKLAHVVHKPLAASKKSRKK